MSKTVKRLLWQRTLDRTVLRQPLPKAPDQAWEGFFGRMQAILDRGDERKRQQLREQRLRPFAAPAFLDALDRAIAEMNKPRPWGPGAYITGSVVNLGRGGFLEGNPVRLVGERGPELQLSHPGWTNLSGTLELEAKLAAWQRNLDNDGEGDSCD